MNFRPKLLACLAALCLIAPPAHAGWGVSWTFQAGPNKGGPAGIVTNGSGYNNPAAISGKQAAFIQGTGSFEQTIVIAEAGLYTVSWLAAVRYWPDTNHDYDVLVNGTRIAHVDSSRLSPVAYKPMSAPMNLVPGRYTLRFQGVNTKGGDHTSFVDAVKIGRAAVAGGVTALDVPPANADFEDVQYAVNTYVLLPPALTTALARLTDLKVTTSGKAIYGRLVSAVTGAYLPMASLVTPPTVKVKGVEVGATTTFVGTRDHEGFLLFLPDGVKAEAADTVTLTAPQAWATVKDDFAEALTDRPAEVCTGRSFVGTDAIKPALRIGFDLGYGFYWDNCSLMKNLRTKMMFWDQTGVAANDANGFPTQLTRDAATCAVIEDPNYNGLDDTGTAVPEGLYAVGWGRASGGVDCSLVSNKATVTERKDLANPGGPDGRGLVRVFDFKRKPGTTRTDFDVRLRVADATRAPRLSYLVIYGPGDFKAVDNTPTVLDDVTDPAAMSSLSLARLAGGLGTTRWTQEYIGYHNTAYACEPEDLNAESMWSWNGWKRSWMVHFKQARPWTQQGSPYIYSPLFGEAFPATLGTALDAPAAGAKQVVEIPDAATAPVFEGLVLTIEGERCRVVSGSGTTWTIERGSESTTPAAHAAGPVSVSGRVPMASLADFGQSNTQVIELVTTAPHHLRTGNHPPYDGNGWASWAMADGSKSLGGNTLRYWELGILVTAPDRFIITLGGAAGPANTTLAAAVDLDPALHTSQVVSPGAQGLPFATAAKVSAKLGADLTVSIPFAASDSYVDAVAAITLDNYPAGHRVYVEYINEPWNWSYPTTISGATLSWIVGRRPMLSFLWQARRTGQIHKRFAAAFAKRGRGDEVRSVLNMQLASAGENVRGIVKRALDEGLPPPDIAVAPYVDFAAWPSLVKGYNAATMDQAVDLYIYNMAYCKSDSLGSGLSTLPTAWSAAFRAAIDATNKELGTSVELYGYEGGVSTAWPVVRTPLSSAVAADATSFPVNNASLFSPGQMLRVGPEWVKVASIAGNVLTVSRAQAGTSAAAYGVGTAVRNAYIESGHDLTYHPNFRIAEFDQFGLWQKYYSNICVTAYSGHWDQGFHQWCQYHWIGQMPGRGDGSDGKADNSLTMATPGLPGSKGPTVNQDLANVSVRGQALIDWNRPPVVTPPPPDLSAGAAAVASQVDSFTSQLGDLKAFLGGDLKADPVTASTSLGSKLDALGSAHEALSTAARKLRADLDSVTKPAPSP